MRIESLLNVYSYPGRAPIVIVYTAAALGGELATDEEGLEVALFRLDTIPWDELAFRSTFEALQDYMKKVAGMAWARRKNPPCSPWKNASARGLRPSRRRGLRTRAWRL